MGKKFQIRELLTRYPVLDALRLKTLVAICSNGMRGITESYRLTRVIAPGARPFVEGKTPALFVLFHARMVGVLQLLHQRSKVTILVSRSRDGEIVSQSLESLGHTLARGSPAHKAVEATMHMIKAARSGQSLAMMADGPRGPIHVVKPGVIRLAEMSGLPIVPSICSARSVWWFWGWDRFMGPLWGTPVIYLYGDPMHVPSDLGDDEREALRLELERRMNLLRETADDFWVVDGGRCESFPFYKVFGRRKN